MKIVKTIQPPAGLGRLLLRMPIYVYRLGLGWLFGQRLLLLNHVGRRTGKPRQSVLEVAEHDRADGSFVVASGWGPDADWYRNVLRRPDVSITVGRRSLPVTAVPLTGLEAGEVFVRYACARRSVAKYVLPLVLGVSVDGSDADFRAVGHHLPFVRFVLRA